MEIHSEKLTKAHTHTKCMYSITIYIYENIYAIYLCICTYLRSSSSIRRSITQRIIIIIIPVITKYVLADLYIWGWSVWLLVLFGRSNRPICPSNKIIFIYNILYNVCCYYIYDEVSEKRNDIGKKGLQGWLLIIVFQFLCDTPYLFTNDVCFWIITTAKNEKILSYHPKNDKCHGESKGIQHIIESTIA